MNAEDDFLVIYSKLLPFILIEKLAKKKKNPRKQVKRIVANTEPYLDFFSL